MQDWLSHFFGRCWPTHSSRRKWLKMGQWAVWLYVSNLRIILNSKKVFLYQPFYIVSAVAFGVTVYISLDIGLGITTLIGGVSNPPDALRSIPLFILTSIWPPLWVFVFILRGVIKQNSIRTALLYFIIMSYIVLKILNERRPMWYYILAAALFVLSQLAWFLLSRVICKVPLSVLLSWDCSTFFCRARISEWMVLS